VLQGEANCDHRLRPRNTLEDCPGWKLDLRPARVHAEDPEPAKQNKGADDRNKGADNRTKATDNRKRLLIIGIRLLVIGIRLLIIGIRLLIIGIRLLIIGIRLLITLTGMGVPIIEQG
jgi:hypothetical protein